MDQILLTTKEITEIAMAALKKVLPRTRISSIKVGRDKFAFSDLEITVVIASGSSVHLSGLQLSRIQDAIATELWKKGDQRFPHLRYLTAQEAKKLAS